jgi:hypothetical protein
MRKIKQTVNTPEDGEITLVSDLHEGEAELSDTAVYDNNGDYLASIGGHDVLRFVGKLWRGTTSTADPLHIFYPEIINVINEFKI